MIGLVVLTVLIGVIIGIVAARRAGNPGRARALVLAAALLSTILVATDHQAEPILRYVDIGVAIIIVAIIIRDVITRRRKTTP